jgi:Ni/Co efflux regulator RcnB
MTLVVLAASLAAPARIVSARDNDHDQGSRWTDERQERHRDDDDDRDRHRRYGDRCFHEEHLRAIRGYYHRHDLPPGLVKRYYRTGELPPGWEARVRPFPVEVERDLPPLPSGYARGYVDGYAVVFQPRTHVVIDFHAVFGN